MNGRGTAKHVVAGLLKLTAAGRDTVRPGAHGAVVLLYHRVGRRSQLAIDLPRALFAAQVDELASGGRIVSLDGLLSAVAGPDAPPVPPVALTFDDGTADFADEALPVLAAAAAPATLYVATDFVDRGRPFPHDGNPLSWAALRDVVSTGLVTVGSHTHTHALLDRLPPDDVADELDRSVKLIEDHLGFTPEHFAYPKALLGSEAAQAAVRRRFRSAAIAGTRANRYGRTDPYRLHRSPVQVADGMRWFRRKARGGMALEDDVRRLVNRRRYEGAVT
ncbi:MAG: polysaccharide deacetylase family protein [Actinomycetota bacterium]|nr:polysaccharide deacetylase family protein [Actinomycetota bacterium]